MSRSIPQLAYVTAFLQTDLFLVFLISFEKKPLPVQWRSNVNYFLVIGHDTHTWVSFQENSI